MILRDQLVEQKAALTQEIRNISFDIYGCHYNDKTVKERRKRLDQAERELMEVCDNIRMLDMNDSAKG